MDGKGAHGSAVLFVAWRSILPACLEEFVNKRLSSSDFYPEKDESERKSLAYALANKMKNEGNICNDSNASIEFVQVNAPTDIEVRASGEGDLVVFKNAVLARVEKNLNNDEISQDNIEELAASIGGKPVDVEHDTKNNCGVFSSGRPAEDKSHLLVDGFIWADRFPEEAQGVIDGKYQLSIEARADKAQCTVCGSVFNSSQEYCNHLSGRKSSGASRKLIGLKARGGAITKKPAGSKTVFNPSQIYVVASHSEKESNSEEQTLSDNSVTSNKEKEKMTCPYCKANEESGDSCSKCNKSLMASALSADLVSALESATSLASEKTTLETKASELETKVTELSTEVENSKKEIYNVTASHRKTLLSVSNEEWTKKEKDFMGLNDEAFNFLVASLKSHKTEPAGIRLPDAAGNSKEPITLKK